MKKRLSHEKDSEGSDLSESAIKKNIGEYPAF
jgi:hypothetical protein